MKAKPRLRSVAIFACTLLVCGVLVGNFMTGGSDDEMVNGLLLARPAFAQGSTAFPADEAGISAYVNVGQSIDLGKAKSAFRGIEAEGDGWVIGIVELTGLPEEEFPHTYISQDGWILAYYSKFAPASRIMQWHGYEGGTISTTTLQDAISKICTTMRIDWSKVRANIGYYHFKYPEATKLVLAVDTTTDGEDNFNFSIPYGVTLFEASWSHYVYNFGSSYAVEGSRLKIDGEQISKVYENEGETSLTVNRLTGDSYLVPDKLHTVSIDLWGVIGGWTGAAIVFIYW